MSNRDPVQEAAKQFEAAIHKAAEDALVNGTGTIRATALGVKHVPPEQFHQQRDPMQEAVERAGEWFAGTDGCGAMADCSWPGDECACRRNVRRILAAALAPYGGLEAIKTLEEGR